MTDKFDLHLINDVESPFECGDESFSTHWSITKHLPHKAGGTFPNKRVPLFLYVSIPLNRPQIHAYLPVSLLPNQQCHNVSSISGQSSIQPRLQVLYSVWLSGLRWSLLEIWSYSNKTVEESFMKVITSMALLQEYS
ncbi:hypothetical protein Sjap_024184 [Stephania japonica]|uniref:Uncharacterized protein n=1 Tax=Stephania japonica TaxID=461633 RepID=A0AAP0EHQ8_9MAGN